MTTSTNFADEWLQHHPPADGGVGVDQHADDAQHDQVYPFTSRPKEKPAGMHCTQQTTAQFTHEEEREYKNIGGEYIEYLLNMLKEYN